MTHRDCKYYLTVDVFKGICKRTKERIAADDESCEKFEKLPQCRYCSHFQPVEFQLGTCDGKFPASPEMNATTCTGFSWN